MFYVIGQSGKCDGTPQPGNRTDSSICCIGCGLCQWNCYASGGVVNEKIQDNSSYIICDRYCIYDHGTDRFKQQSEA